MEDSVIFINNLLRQRQAPFECELNSEKGRVLKGTKAAWPTDNLFVGNLLHKVSEDIKHPVYIELTRLFHFDKSDALDYSPMWYWCALNSLPFAISDSLPVLSSETHSMLKMLYHPRIISPSVTIRRVADAISQFLLLPLTDDQLIELDTMTVIWTLNCFEHADDPLTYASFFLPSFMSHSCAPNSMWSVIGDTFHIRAQRHIDIGDEITVSYLSEEFGLRPIHQRMDHLKSTKFFSCDCPRCTSPYDDTRGFPLPARLLRPSTCFVRYPLWHHCACGCGSQFSLTPEEVSLMLAMEAELVQLVTQYDGDTDGDIVPAKPNPELIGSPENALRLFHLVEQLGLYHWASCRALMQLAEYYRSTSQYVKAIECTKLRILSKRNYVKICDPDVSSSLAWALEELGDLIALHVSGSITAGLSEDARERYCFAWMPRSGEDRETLKHSGAVEAYKEASCILTKIFGQEHEHTKTADDKLNRLIKKLG